MAVRAKFLGRDAVMRRLRKLVPDAEPDLAKAQMDAAEELAAAIRPRAPERTGEYRNSIDAGRLSEIAGYAKSNLRATKDPNATGIFALFTWRWLEFGTRYAKAQPHIFPTYRAMRRRIRRKIAGAMNKAVRRARKG